MGSELRLEPEDRAVLERVAARIVELRLEVPAILTLESSRPLSLVAGQAMLFFEPLVRAFLHLPDYRRFAGLIERREVLEELVRLIEARADAAQAERRTARAAAAEHRRAARSQRPSP